MGNILGVPFGILALFSFLFALMAPSRHVQPKIIILLWVITAFFTLISAYFMSQEDRRY